MATPMTCCGAGCPSFRVPKLRALSNARTIFWVAATPIFLQCIIWEVVALAALPLKKISVAVSARSTLPLSCIAAALPESCPDLLCAGMPDCGVPVLVAVFVWGGVVSRRLRASHNLCALGAALTQGRSDPPRVHMGDISVCVVV